MKDAGLDPGDLEWVLTASSIQGGRAAAAQLLDHPDPPTGFICHLDDIAAGVLAELRAAGLVVPGEAAVVGYDDSALAEALDLTSVHQPFAETGRIAISLLFATMDGTTGSTQQISLKPRLAAGGQPDRRFEGRGGVLWQPQDDEGTPPPERAKSRRARPRRGVALA